MKKENLCGIVSLVGIAILVYVVFFFGKSENKTLPRPSRIPTVTPMNIPDPAPAPAPKPQARRIVSNAYSESRSMAAIDAACRAVMQKYPRLAAGRFDSANAGVCYYSDGTFDVSSQVSWLPSGQSVSVVTCFKVTVWEKDGEWYFNAPKMSGYGF